MADFTAGHAVRRLAEVIGRPIDVVIFNREPLPDAAVLAQYAREHKVPLPLGDLPAGCRLIEGGFWRRSIARHDRQRLRAAVWLALSEQVFAKDAR
jgi:hypothetical protein